jgi:hypothetical protein
LVSRGFTVAFLTDQVEVPWIRKKLIALGPQVSLISGIYIPNPVEDVLLVDSYQLDTSNEFFSSKDWLIRISIRDDNTPEYRFEVSITPSFDEPTIKESSSGVAAAGKEFFLFRDSVRAWRNNFSINKEFLKKIVVSGGGTDPTNFGPSLVKFLDLNFQSLEILLFSNETNVKMHSNFLQVIEFGELFDENVKDCYLAFCPSSTMSVELAAAGIPVGIGLAVPNQKGGHLRLTEKGLACPIGRYEQGKGWKFEKEMISQLLNKSEYRDKFSANALEFFNLDGATKTVDLVLSQATRIQ